MSSFDLLKTEPRALAATTVFALETVTRLAPAAQIKRRE